MTPSLLRPQFVAPLAAAASLGFAIAQAQPAAPASPPTAHRERPARPPVTLHVGDPAPALAVSKWIKGTPVRALEKGRVYVIECWATWCGPCRASMPHLSALAKEFAGKATFVSVDVLESAETKTRNGEYLPHVEAFVNAAHDMMAYNVAMDTTADKSGAVAKEWLVASGQPGIPCSFVIDKKGRIAWIGHPAMGLGEAVQLAIDDRLDAAAVARIEADVQTERARDAALGKQLNDAVAANDKAAIVRIADEMLKHDSTAGPAISAKYKVLSSGAPASARAFIAQVIKDRGNAPLPMVFLAQDILSRDDTGPDCQVALSLMQAAAKCSDPADPWISGLLAKAYYKSGDSAKAAAVQQAVVDSMKNGLLVWPEAPTSRAEATLKEYRNSSQAKT